MGLDWFCSSPARDEKEKEKEFGVPGIQAEAVRGLDVIPNYAHRWPLPQDLQCYLRRWQEPFNFAVLWSGWGSVHLMQFL